MCPACIEQVETEMKIPIFASLSIALLGAALMATMGALPAKGANTPPPPPVLPKMGKIPNPPSAGNALPKPLKPGAMPSLPKSAPVMSNPIALPKSPMAGWRVISSKALGVSTLLQLDGAVVCLADTGAGESGAVMDFFSKNNMTVALLPGASVDELLSPFQKGRCDVLVVKASQAKRQLAAVNAADAYLLLSGAIE